MRRSAYTVALVLLLAACSGGSSHVVEPTTRAVVPTTRPQAPGTILGRMYADGGPPPPPPAPTNRSAPVFGTITVRRAGAVTVLARPTQDSRGYFRLAVAPGRYVVQGKPGDGFKSVSVLTQVVVVRSGATATVDLGIHMS
jgi:hypothetical protein